MFRYQQDVAEVAEQPAPKLTTSLLAPYCSLPLQGIQTSYCIISLVSNCQSLAGYPPEVS